MEYQEKNEPQNSYDAKYNRAQERILEIKEFYSKLLRSIVLIAFLAAINYYTNEWEFMWFLWAAFGLGISLVFKAIKVFGMGSLFGKGWEERKIREFMEEEQQQNKWN